MTTTAFDEAIETLAASQCGRFTRAQVRDLGEEAARAISSCIQSGRWRRLTRRVLALPGSSMDWRGDIWTARLHVGDDAVVSHRSAARLHSFPAVEHSVPCLTVPSGSNRKYGDGRLFQRKDLPPAQVVTLSGLVITSAARTLVDLAPGASRTRLEAWLDYSTAERLVTPDELVGVVRLCSRSGKPSLNSLNELLSEYLPAPGTPQGTLERALGNVIRMAGLPPGVSQFAYPGDASVEQFCDRAWLQPRLILECDGRKWHDRIAAARIDKRRDATAAAQGWQTIRYGYEELVRNPEDAAQELRGAYERRIFEMIGAEVG